MQSRNPAGRSFPGDGAAPQRPKGPGLRLPRPRVPFKTFKTFWPFHGGLNVVENEEKRRGALSDMKPDGLLYVSEEKAAGCPCLI